MGALTIRLPKSLHQQVKMLAAREGISINQFVMLATAEKAALLKEQRRQIAMLEERGRRAEADLLASGKTIQERMRELLDHAPDVEPVPEDRLPEGL